MFCSSEMSTRRFDDQTMASIEQIPLIHFEHEIPPPPPLPASMSKKSFNARRRATIAAARALMNQPVNVEYSSHDDSDVDSSNQSQSNDGLPIRTTNKFLEELRLKRQELIAKAKNISIDQRIAFHRRQRPRNPCAKDLFNIHFEINDDEENISTRESHFFTEESQEKIRGDIFKELDRQRRKQFHKYHRHLLLGRALLVGITLLLIFMSLTLIYVVFDLYDRANFLDSKLPENEFVSILSDKSNIVY